MIEIPRKTKEALIKKFGPVPKEFFETEYGDFFGLVEGRRSKAARPAGHNSGGACAMPHTSKRKQRDLQRTPWVRLGPREKKILDTGWAHVQSVPYKVSLRWLFYRLLQDGFYKTKGDYKNNFTKLFSRARHTEQGGWRPNTLEDEGRAVIVHAGGVSTEEEAIEAMRANVGDASNVAWDHFFNQENYIELWFEANAMTSQFEHYSSDIDLVPMGGTASIPYKYKLARRIEAAAERYGKPIRILYFGDEDEAGHVIQATIEKDVRRWTEAEFEITWCGLTKEQAKRYRIPENFEKKGYQWEALPDKGAREIITKAVGKYIDTDVIEETNETAEAFQEKWQEKIDKLFDELEG